MAAVREELVPKGEEAKRAWEKHYLLKDRLCRPSDESSCTSNGERLDYSRRREDFAWGNLVCVRVVNHPDIAKIIRAAKQWEMATKE
jgi:hypothetical protein